MSTLHHRAKDVFLAALAQPPSDRTTYVADACGEDTDLRQEVESLLAFHDDSTGILHDRRVAEARFEPGQVFAGRYRMTRRLGSGGMGDIWQADDLVLKTEVALKLIRSTNAAARERILDEVRLARQITHPSICRVFDVGEAEGGIFYSMELVRGEDLAALLRRVGRLPSDKVVDIARQLCAGLAAAHARGVLHRDLKPANILVDEAGLVRISDFGIAIQRTDAGQHLNTGTPRYMAPEQRTQGALLSEQTDIYSLGLVLYELLAGPDTFSRSSQAGQLPKPSTLAPNVNAQLERVVMQALSADPRDRPASALAMAATLPAIGTIPAATFTNAPALWLRTRWRVAAVGLAAMLLSVAATSSYFLTSGSPALTEQDTIVLADFDNATGEAVFDGTLKVALAVALEQSPFLKVFPDDRARETLRLMQRSPDERITRSVARDVARREMSKALLAGSIASLGRNYVLTLEAVNAETGDSMAREQVEATSKEEVLKSLGEVASRMRGKLGESLASVQKFDVPLPRATTASLDALHAYSLALSDGVEVPRLEAIPQLQRAIELDPNFAMAHAFLSGVYANTGQSALAPAFSRKAFELRDRVSERERFFISWRYYRDAVQDLEKGLELAQSWIATYPREAFAFNALGVSYLRLGRFDDSTGPFRDAIRLDPRFVPAYGNLSAALMGLNQYVEARAVLKQADDQRLDFNGARRLSYLLAFVQGDAQIMAREFEASVGVGETNAAFGWQAHGSAFSGRIAAAHEEFHRGIQMSLQGNFTEVAAQLTMEDAEGHAIVGQCDEARRDVKDGLALGRDNATLERAGRVLALCGEGSESLALSREVERRFPDATLTKRMTLPITAAIIAIQQGNANRGLELLESVRPFDHAPSGEFWPAYLRGQAYLKLRNSQAANVEFQSIIDHRGEVPLSVLYPLAHVGRARAEVMRGDTAKAIEAYDAFFKLWPEADPDLPILKEARLSHAHLRAAPHAANGLPTSTR